MGVGYLGFIHVSKLKNLREVKEIFVWDINPDRMNQAKEELGAIPTGSLDEIV